MLDKILDAADKVDRTMNKVDRADRTFSRMEQQKNRVAQTGKSKKLVWILVFIIVILAIAYFSK